MKIVSYEEIKKIVKEEVIKLLGDDSYNSIYHLLMYINQDGKEMTDQMCRKITTTVLRQIYKI